MRKVPWLSNFNSAEFRIKALTLFNRLIRTKNPESLVDRIDEDGTQLKKCLTTLDLTSLGVGSCVGTGMYLVAGMVAKDIAGPGVILSFIIAAVASIFSGACYAEFGVRVPHTTGSAYMYSYVTVGEFIAFVIGWNMVLEYLIGTSACACALSACFDALVDGAISQTVKQNIGTLFGEPPDFIAFIITVLMMLVLVTGVKKSLVFNNILNSVNLAIWVFVMTAGLFYVNGDNWSKHKGFLPYGWSGVLTGAATCFYAFIGFDIIATTGEEATNPKKSIPVAIVGSLIIILIAYVTSSFMMTLMVPYDELSSDSALVEVWSQVGSNSCMKIVAIGAIAGLTVSLFGSMFPMPRVVYAMARDGLIYRSLGNVWQRTNTPAMATLIFGLAASFASLLISLRVLVEMMSIGTLLAYTLVSTCVLILRYQPTSTTLIELLPESIRTPIPGTPLKGSPTRDSSFSDLPSGSKSPNLNPEYIKTALSGVSPTNPFLPRPSPPIVGTGMFLKPGGNPFVSGGLENQQVTVKKLTRSSIYQQASVDSDDTTTLDDNDSTYKDDEFLVSGDRMESKFYGSVPSGSASYRMTWWEQQMKILQYKFPGILPWTDEGPATEESGRYVMKMVGIMYICIILFDIIVVVSTEQHGGPGYFSIFLMIGFFCSICWCLIVISRRPQSRKALLFLTPGLPFVPAIAVMINIYLIFKLSSLTLLRFTIWMAIGLFVYFRYGINNSDLEQQSQQFEMGLSQDFNMKPSPSALDKNINELVLTTHD